MNNISSPLEKNRRVTSRLVRGLLASAAFLLCASAHAQAQGKSSVDPVQKAASHPIVREIPSVNIIEGGILGNGEMGVVVTLQPDAVVIYFGHNAAWDQRMEPVDTKALGTFQETLAKMKAIPTTLKRLEDDPWYMDYTRKAKKSYQNPYPRPVACGSVVLGIDRRNTEALGHQVHIEKGLCRVDFLVGGKKQTLELFADMTAGNRVWGRMVDDGGKPIAAPFIYMAILPNKALPEEFPRHKQKIDAQGGAIGMVQILPYEEKIEQGKYRPHPKDRAFALGARVNSAFLPKTVMPRGFSLGGSLAAGQGEPFYICADLRHGMASDVALEFPEKSAPAAENFTKAADAGAAVWRAYWEKSGVHIDDDLLEKVWYRNNYFLRCALRPGTVAPGMYAFLPWPGKPAPWHGDYHMDYNTQQAYWSTFSSNHPELNVPYVDMVNKMLPLAQDWAKEYYQMRGAFFPVSFYPIDMPTYPYAAPVFNWMVCVSPWTVQGLWWHYLYTMDTDYLRDRCFPPIKSVTEFLVDFMKRPDTRGASWGDDKYHIFPSYPPELYHFKPGLPAKYNADTLPDLALTRFIFDAYLRACAALKIEGREAQTMRDVRELLSRMADYPTGDSQRGKVFVSIPAEDPEHVHNVPVSLMSVFPAEQHGLHSPPDMYKIAANTYRNQQNEGGNEIVFLNLQAARLGMLDIERFKRQVNYAMVPNGTCADMNLQAGGRYTMGVRDYDWMKYYGIWFENFSLPVVINECMLQSYTGELRFFPNWPKDKDAEFRTLRAAGAFLVSAKHGAGRVQWIDIVSEAGGTLNVISPWEGGAVCTQGGKQTTLKGARFSIETKKGERIELRPSGK